MSVKREDITTNDVTPQEPSLVMEFLRDNVVEFQNNCIRERFCVLKLTLADAA